MIKKLLVTSLFAVAAAGVFAKTTQTPAPLTNTMDAYVIELNSKGKEVAVHAETVEPGEMVEYRLTYNNISEKALNGLVVTGPIPSNTQYIGQTAQAGATSQFIVSIDGGKTFESEPVKRIVKDADGKDKEVIIPAEQYTHLRWNVNDTLNAGAQQVYTYRVAVK